MRIRLYIILLFSVFSGNQAFAQLFSKEYRIALVLPFRSAGNQNNLSEAMLDYYEGFKMAAKDLEGEGLNLKLYVFDCEKDSMALQTAFEHPDMPKMDVIVGPIYEENLKVAETFCAAHNIILVSPLKYFVPESYERVINFFVPDSIRVASIAEKCGRLYPNHKIYIATDNSTESKKQAEIIRRTLSAMKVGHVKTTYYANSKLSPIVAHPDSVIIISTISSKDAKSTLLRAIKYQAHSLVYAELDWYSPTQNVRGVDEPQMVYPEVNYVSAADSASIYFRERFFDTYAGEPSKYAYIGYDQATFLCYGLMTFGPQFCKHLPDAEYRGLINMIRLKDTPAGLINIAINYLQVIEDERIEYHP
ncbi:MAG: hypothetical protein IT244_11900 [Bacteroidia bacterium]|nr:hypothetical protein [Bacteroidia bacterium]